MARDNNSNDKELMIRWLGEVIHREISKPDGEADMELVEECEETLLYLSDSVSYSEEELREKARLIISGDVKHLDSSRKARLRIIRRAAAIAACVVLFLFGSMVTAYAFVPSFRSYVKQVIGLQDGSAIDADGITFQYAGDTKKYSTLDELVGSEQLNGILFPRLLTDEIQISAVYLARSDDQTQVSIIFTVDDLSVSILNDTGVDLSELSVTSEIKEINGIVSYISDDEGIFTSVTVFDGYVYYITSSSREKTITILESMFYTGD